jgi:hypothetical protein
LVEGFILASVAEIEDERYKAAKARVQQLRAFYTHLATFVVINIFLIVLNLITDPDELWFYWVTLGWGVGLVLHGLQVFGSGSIFGRGWEERKIKQYMERDQL